MIKYYLGSYYLISGGNKIHFFFPPEEEREYFIHQRYDDYTPIKYNSNIVELSGRENRMSKLDIAKQVIKEYYTEAQCGIFDCRNIVGDPMATIYDDGSLTIDICYYYSYFEVFGLTDIEFQKLVFFYNGLGDN